MEARDFLEAYAINRLIDLGENSDVIFDILNKRYLKLSYNTGATKVTQIIMLDEENNFRGIDAIGRLVLGKFIDDRYIIFYIINNDKSITKFIGYNSESHITITLVNTKISTGLKIEPIETIDESMSIVSVYHKIKEATQNIEESQLNNYLEYLNEINLYQRCYNRIPTIAYRLEINDEIPTIKDLTK